MQPSFQDPATVKLRTLVDLLSWRAHTEGGRAAYLFLQDGEAEEQRITYAELYAQAKRIAGMLQDRCEKGARVLLLYPPGLDYIAAFFGCLYAGMIAVPAYPPRANNSVKRLQAIIADAEVTVALTTSGIMSRVQRLSQDLDLRLPHWLATDQIETGMIDNWKRPEITGDVIALL